MPDFQSLPDNEHSFYIITIRDPYDRIISAFSYEHPLNQAPLRGEGSNQRNGRVPSKKEMAGRLAAFRCFPSLEAFVEYLGGTDFSYPYDANQIVTGDCQAFARAVMNSKVRRFNHFFFNYGKILSLLPLGVIKHIPIYVVRKEYLWKDWNAVNHLLDDGEKRAMNDNLLAVGSESTTEHARNVTGMNLPVTRELSENGRERLCRALGEEYQHYNLLLKVARNLSEQDVKKTLSYSNQNCPRIVANIESK